MSAVVLKRLEDAEMDNDNILAVIDGKHYHPLLKMTLAPASHTRQF